MNETTIWNETYASHILKERRLSVHEKRLEKIGILWLPKTGKILETCSGNGENIEILKKHGYTDVTGCDITDGVDARDLSAIKDRTYDWVICLHSLHHIGGIKDIEKSFKEAYRVLKHNGRFSIIDHYDSVQLRLAMKYLLSDLPKFGWMKELSRQMKEEKELMYNFMDTEKQYGIPLLLHFIGFKQWFYKKDLFFFYYTGVKS